MSGSSIFIGKFLQPGLAGLNDPWGLDVLSDGERLLKTAFGFLDLAQISELVPQIAEGIALPSPVADLARDHQRLLIRADSLLNLAQSSIGDAQIAEDSTLTLPVADLVKDRQRCPVVTDGLFDVAQSGESQCDRPQQPPLKNQLQFRPDATGQERLE
jgi:hypothetical protein